MTDLASLTPVQKLFESFAAADPEYSAQLAVYVGGDLALDITVGAGMQPDSLLPVYSSSKGATAVVIALLVQRGQLDLDERVATYWPEFGAAGKSAVTVRQLLSHQAGLPGVDGGFTWDELLAHDPLAARLAAQRPFWQPGKACLYHAVTIGTLADELVRRIDGRPVGEVLRAEVTGPRHIDAWLGTPASEDHRVVQAMPPSAADMASLDLAAMAAAAADPITSLSLPSDGNIFELFARVNDEGFRRVGQPAAGMLASARGLAKLYASLRHDIDGQRRVLDDDTIAQMAQIQFDGPELGSGLHVRFGVLFQVPCTPRWAFGSHRAFGHDGAGGSLAFADPAHDIAFGYTVQHLPLPGGMDARAVELTRALRDAIG